MANAKLPSLNKVLIIGNLVKDPELRYTYAGVPVANFKITSNKKFKDNFGILRKDGCYIGVVAWQKLAESCSRLLKKGSAVLVEGELRSRLKEDQEGTKRSFVEIKAWRPVSGQESRFGSPGGGRGLFQSKPRGKFR